MPNHLYIGSRLMRSNYSHPTVWAAAGKYCDVITVNYYSAWGPDPEQMAYWQSLAKRPFMVTEFYVKGEDAGLPNNTGAGWIVPTQADRGRFYQHFALGLLESRSCVGWHWFKYQDNDPAQTNAEPSNIDSNKGIVGIDYEPYPELIERMKALNREVYPLTEYFDERRITSHVSEMQVDRRQSANSPRVVARRCLDGSSARGGPSTRAGA